MLSAVLVLLLSPAHAAFPAMERSTAPITVVYPTEGEVLSLMEGEFVIGSVSDHKAPFTINGASVAHAVDRNRQYTEQSKVLRAGVPHVPPGQQWLVFVPQTYGPYLMHPIHWAFIDRWYDHATARGPTEETGTGFK